MEEMEKSYPGKTISMIWNNISKMSAITKSGGGPVDASVHEIEHEYFHVIPKEIEILKPNILIFFTGPGENTYYRYIQENFTMDGEPLPLASLCTRCDQIANQGSGVGLQNPPSQLYNIR